MTIKTVYVKADSKAALNRRLAQGDSRAICAREFGLHGCELNPLVTYPHGTVVKIFRDSIAGNPIAIAYGTWDSYKNIVK